jgi:hypothetical protein
LATGHFRQVSKYLVILMASNFSKSVEPPKSSIINMSTLASRFRRVAPVIPHNIVSPMNFSVPPPNFNIPPLKIQSPSAPKFFAAQPISNSHRLSTSSTESYDRFEGLKRIQNSKPSGKTDATPNQIDRLLNELPKKSNLLDPRLANNKGHDPRRPNVPHASATNSVNSKGAFQVSKQ